MVSKNILIVSTSYMSVDISGNNRTNFMPDFLHKKGHNVTLITSNFNHHKKEIVKDYDKKNYKTIVIEELGYKKNISIKRIMSIREFKKNLSKYFKTTKDCYDIVIVFTPPHSIASLVIKQGKLKGWKTILDVRDLWPEAYRLVVKNKFIYRLIFWPLFLQANKNYKNADYIIAVSKTYVERTKRSENHSDVIYLGTSFSLVDKIKNNQRVFVKPKNEIWLTYAGTIGNSYNLDNLIRAYRSVLDKGYNNIKLLLIGSGPLKEDLINLDIKLETNVIFHDRMPYDKMISYLLSSDISVNSLSENAPQSIINKHMDYAAVGLPVINTQKLAEYSDIVSNEKIGINVNSDDIEEYSNAIITLAENKHLRTKLGKNHRKLGEKLFDRDYNYNKLIDVINKL